MARRRFGCVSNPDDREGVFIAFTVQGERRKRKVRSKADADRKLAAIEEMELSGRSMSEVLRDVFGEVTRHGMTFREAAPLFLEYREPRKKPSTFKADVTRLRVILRAAWTKKALDSITTRDLAAHVTKRMSGKRGASGPTANRDTSLISALYKWAIKMGYATTNPKKLLEAESEAGRERTVWLSDEESQTLVASAHPEFRPALRCLIFAGLRRGELMTLEWRSVDFDNRWLVIEPEFTKTGQTRLIRMAADLEADLRMLSSQRRSSERNVFLRPRKRVPHSKGSLRHWLAKSIAACPKDSSIHGKNVTLHSLRHTFASYLVQEGAPYQEIADLMGHLTVHVMQRYGHMAKDAGVRSIELLDKRLARTGTSQIREVRDGYRTMQAHALNDGQIVPLAFPALRGSGASCCVEAL